MENLNRREWQIEEKQEEMIMTIPEDREEEEFDVTVENGFMTISSQDGNNLTSFKLAEDADSDHIAAVVEEDKTIVHIPKFLFEVVKSALKRIIPTT